MTQKEKLRLVELLTSRYNIDELNELTTLLQKDGCKIEIIAKQVHTNLIATSYELLEFVKQMAKRYPNSPWIYEEANKLIKKVES